jgi:mono/diheme cytochrome c family protein
MNDSLESKAFALAMLAASFSLGATMLAAVPIKRLSAGGPAPERTDASTLVPAVSSDPAVIAQGRLDFVMSCVECHADDATGDEGPDLHNLAISNARIATTIRHGVRGEMPAFAKKYNDAQIATLLSYLRTLK